MTRPAVQLPTGRVDGVHWTELRAECLRLLDSGHSTFPVGLTKRGDPKKPLIKGFHDLQPNVRDVRRWPWSKARGLGWSLPPGLIALDVDVKNGQRGMEHLAELIALLGPLPPTATQTSPTGGSHLVFRMRPQLVALVGKLRLPDESWAHIDLARHGVLYLRLYDLTLPLQDVAELPSAWCDYLTRPLPEAEKELDGLWTPDALTADLLSSLSLDPPMGSVG